MSDAPQPGPGATDQPFFHVEKLYLKDLSFESPNAPDVFLEQVEPKVEFNLDTSARQVNENHYEAQISITVTVRAGENALFLIEIVYAGLFEIRNIEGEQLSMLLGIECPSILYPYMRSIVTSMVAEGGFKPMVLDPINFAALYQQAKLERQQAAAGGGAAPAAH